MRPEHAFAFWGYIGAIYLAGVTWHWLNRGGHRAAPFAAAGFVALLVGAVAWLGSTATGVPLGLVLSVVGLALSCAALVFARNARK